MDIKIEKARIGLCFNKKTNETKYNIEFKAENSRYYHGYSTETFDSKSEAQSALEDHRSGKRVYDVTHYHKNGKHFLCKRPQICYKTNDPCKHDCNGLCKESC